MLYNIVVLPGDGVGPEIIKQTIKILRAVEKRYELKFNLQEALIGGASLDQKGLPITDEVLDLCRKSEAILLGAIGGPQWDNLEPPELRPEKGALLKLRKELDLFANLRPVKIFPALKSASPLKDRILEEGVDFIIVRELTSGLYFGEPKGIKKLDSGEEYAYNTMAYRTSEIRRVAHAAFRVARERKEKVCSADKANVLEVSQLWRRVVSEVGSEYSNIELTHMYVDNFAMQIIKNPSIFDVVVTSNMFGDIVSDEASMIAGSLGMLPSASLGEKEPFLYEPIHGSAPKYAGQNKVNPIAAILSAAMMLKFSFHLDNISEAVEKAVEEVLDEGYRTYDLAEEGKKLVGTNEMGSLIAERI